jgi:hypothetical protein
MELVLGLLLNGVNGALHQQYGRCKRPGDDALTCQVFE